MALEDRILSPCPANRQTIFWTRISNNKMCSKSIFFFGTGNMDTKILGMTLPRGWPENFKKKLKSNRYYWSLIVFVVLLLLKNKKKKYRNLCLRSVLDSSSRRRNVYILKLSSRLEVNLIPQNRPSLSRDLLTLYDNVRPTPRAFKGRVFCSRRVPTLYSERLIS